MKVGAECLKKANGPGCKQCGERKVRCSLVGLRRTVEKKKDRVEER
jgi:hypothetical protein